MADPIQASSSIPLPSYQTLKGGHDPLPVSSPRALDRSSTARAEDDAANTAGAFKDHLDQTSVTLVEKSKPRKEVDVVDLINSGSVYGQPGTATTV